jgi:3-phenylpropionate/trans-cinnamate dioxygenase ferredoxin subunit
MSAQPTGPSASGRPGDSGLDMSAPRTSTDDSRGAGRAANAGYVRVARRADVPPGSMIRVEAGGRPIALANVAGEFYAIDDTCSHEEASLSEGGLAGEVVVCPRHGARFNVKTGRVLSLPAVRSVATYAVKVEGDDVLVATEPHRSAGLPHRR